MKITKKRWVLIALFVCPLLFFLVLSTGINNFKKLPVLTHQMDLNPIEMSIPMQAHVTVLCFVGNALKVKKGGLFNLNQKIYKEFYGYTPFQIIAIYPKTSENEVRSLRSDLGAFTNMSKWNFIPMEKETITLLHDRLKTDFSLDSSLYSKSAYLIDKELRLRGRENDDGRKLFGYNIESVAELNNKMEDDIKVLLYEYRAALKNKMKAERKN